MRILSTNLTVQDFLAAIERGEITVNRDYQRSSGVWPDAARSYLIETVLLEYPIPKLSLHQITDARTGSSHKELVDGQQRSDALRDFKVNRFALSSVVENKPLRGLRYDSLSDEQRATFLSYQLSLDVFLGAEPGEIREVFRRMNSYTVPLNAEEQRHAQWQGAFKWFLHRLGLEMNDAWVDMGVFTQRQVVRMADVKLLAEVCHAMLYGISTTSKRVLDRLYRDHDDEFKAEEEFEERLTRAHESLREWEQLHRTGLMKHFQVYTLLLAIMHIHSPLDPLLEVFDSRGLRVKRAEGIMQALTRLLDAVEKGEERGKYARFVKASSEKTNVKSEREVRFRFYCQALAGA